MTDLPAWIKEGDFPLDTRLEPKGRWVNTPLNDLAVPRHVGQVLRIPQTRGSRGDGQAVEQERLGEALRA